MARWCGSSTPAELRARRVQSSRLSALEKKEGSAGWSGEERSASADESGRVGAGSGRGCRAAGDAGTWSPRGGRSLPRSARGRAASRGTARGWAEASAARDGVSRPAHEVGRRAWAGSLARRAGFCRRARSEAAAREEEKSFSK